MKQKMVSLNSEIKIKDGSWGFLNPYEMSSA